jgi:hypothetical protein
MSAAEMRAMRAEMGEVRSFVGELYDDYRARKDAETSTAVEEVPVNDRAAKESGASPDNGTGQAGTSSAAAQPPNTSPSARTGGLRRRHR